MNTFMQRPLRRTLPILFTAGILMISCQKGDVGPQGAQGQQGSAGTQGPSGRANEKTYEFTALPTNWYSSGATWTFSGKLPALTQGIIDTGSVNFYWTENETQTLMPFTLTGIDYMYYTSILSGSGSFEVTVTEAGPYAINNPSSLSPVTFKVIIDP